MERTSILFCLITMSIWAPVHVDTSVFHSSTEAHMLLRSRRANSFLEELKPPSLERECNEEICDFEEAREIFQTREATLNFWTVYAEYYTVEPLIHYVSDGNQCNPNLCENGLCVDQFLSFLCHCDPGFEGKYCHLRSTAFSCLVNNGDCDHSCQNRKDRPGRVCTCIKGYQLQDNSKECKPINQDSCGQILIPKSIFNPKPIQGLQPWLVGGEIGRKGESPWQAVILNASGKFHCGGVLIDENWVLTAAHCLETSVRFSVRLGDYMRFKHEGTEVTLPVTRVVPHPDYSSKTLNNDIALLKLAKPVKFSTYILPACLPVRELAERVLHLNGTKTVVTGWGKENETQVRYSATLNYISVPIVGREVCADHMSNNLTDNVLCAGILGTVKDACEGDSGGPMMTLYRNTWFLIGLVSWGEGCGRTDKLGIYTKVSNYLDWIHKVQHEATGV